MATLFDEYETTQAACRRRSRDPASPRFPSILESIFTMFRFEEGTTLAAVRSRSRPNFLSSSLPVSSPRLRFSLLFFFVSFFSLSIIRIDFSSQGGRDDRVFDRSRTLERWLFIELALIFSKYRPCNDLTSIFEIFELEIDA